MSDAIKREEAIHGKKWGGFHGGYFSDPAIAAPLVGKILEWAGRSKANAIVDLGGGTGYLLSRLQAGGIEPGVSLVNLDDSDKQLEAAKENGIACVRAAIDQFSRRDLGPEERQYLFMMRSVLHYFGEAGLSPTLRHLRAQAKPGELFIHQTASYEHSRDADCLNALYRMLKTTKWYPTVDFLKSRLTDEGWQVLEVLPAPALPLSSSDLAERYNIDPATMLDIGRILSREHSVPADVLSKKEDAFCAYLHYWIFVCKA